MMIPKERLNLVQGRWKFVEDVDIDGLVDEWMISLKPWTESVEGDFSQLDEHQRTWELVGQAFKLRELWQQFHRELALLEDMVADDLDEDDDEDDSAGVRKLKVRREDMRREGPKEVTPFKLTVRREDPKEMTHFKLTVRREDMRLEDPKEVTDGVLISDVTGEPLKLKVRRK